MQTVRKYAYLVVIGLVAALVFTNSLSKVIFHSSQSVVTSLGETSRMDLPMAIYGLGFVFVLVAFLVVRNALFGIPRRFLSGIKNFQRRVIIFLMIAVVSALFLVA